MAPGPAWHDWALWITAAALGAAAAAVLLWSVVSDRPRGRRRCPRCWYDMTSLAPAAPGAQPTLGVDLRIDRGWIRRRDRLSRRYWEGRIALPIRVAAPEAPVLEPVSGEPADSAARRAVTVALDVPSPDDVPWPTPAFLRVAIRRAAAPELSGVALGVAIELLFDGEPVRTIPVHGTGEAVPHPPEPARLLREVGDVRRPATALSRWTLRIRGDRDAALLELTCDRYWAGSFDIPLADLVPAYR